MTGSDRWLVMWGLAFAIYFSCKLLTWLTRPLQVAPAWRHLGYLLVWPGMNAPRFLDGTAIVPPAAWTEWQFAAAKLGLGIGLVGWLACAQPNLPLLVEGWLALIGLTFVLHFGTFHLLSCGWRTIGVDAPPLMDWPISAVSVSDFWGRRWNRAFRDLTHRYLFRPLTPMVGGRAALVLGFLISGLVHEIVITLPAGGGYGGPTAYFVVQAAGLLVERSPVGRNFRLGHGLRGRLFTAAIVLGPVGWLFPPVFQEHVILPFVREIGERIGC